MEKLSISSLKTLNNGNSIPIIGFGTYQMHESAEAEPAVLAALEAGYRHIDTAQMYENETAVGRAVLKSGLNRADIFVTTKVYEVDLNNPVAALQQSLDNLGFDYVDLYLIHWPISGWQKLWPALVDFQKQGLTKNIGVSNFTIRHLEELKKLTDVTPQVNQVEFSPFLYQKNLLAYCNANKIAIEAYSPLTRGHKLDDPIIEELGQKYHKTPAQIMIRWSLQHGLVPLPKSSKAKRIRENVNIFDFKLSPDDILRLDNLSNKQHYCWNPGDDE